MGWWEMERGRGSGLRPRGHRGGPRREIWRPACQAGRQVSSHWRTQGERRSFSPRSGEKVEFKVGI